VTIRPLDGLFVNPKANTSHGYNKYNTKFEVSSLSHSRDILGELIIKNESRDVTMPLSGIVCRRLGLAMINMHTKFQVSTFTHYEDMKGSTKCRDWCGLGVMGHLMSPAMSPFVRSHMTSNSTLIAS